MSQSLLLKFFPVPKFLLRSAIGLDISDQSLKFIELLKKGSQLKIGRLGEVAIPVGVIEGGEIKKPEEFRQILLDLKKEWHFTNVFISLPDDHSYTFYLSLPPLKPEEIYDAIELQIEEYVPLPAPEIVFDYEVLGREELAGNLSVGVAALPRHIVVGYQEVLALVGINLLAIETQESALARALFKEGKDSNLVIVDLGKNHTTISWVKAGVAIHAATVPIGGLAITHNLEKSLNLEFDEAEKLKRTQGLLRSESNRPVFEAMLPAVAAICDEIERLTTFWLRQGEKEEIKLEQIVLTGGQSSLPGLAEYLSNNIGCPVAVGNPWTKVFPAGTIIKELPLNEALRYGVAIGLALRNFK